MSSLEPAASACLERTRSAVLNVLVGVGLGIALSGWLLRWRDRWPLMSVSEPVRRGMLCALLAIVLGSFLARRILGGRGALREPEHRATRFFQAHLVAASIAALAIPLGLAYGWTTRPLLNEVAPFWIAALALGFLSFPRASELEGFDAPIPPPSEAQA